MRGLKWVSCSSDMVDVVVVVVNGKANLEKRQYIFMASEQADGENGTAVGRHWRINADRINSRLGSWGEARARSVRTS